MNSITLQYGWKAWHRKTHYADFSSILYLACKGHWAHKYTRTSTRWVCAHTQTYHTPSPYPDMHTTDMVTFLATNHPDNLTIKRAYQMDRLLTHVQKKGFIGKNTSAHFESVLPFRTFWNGLHDDKQHFDRPFGKRKLSSKTANPEPVLS